MSTQINKIFDGTRFPLAVIVAHNPDVVGRAVRWARNNSFCVTAKSSGHSVDGIAVRNATILLDMATWKHLRVNTTTKVVEVAPAINNLDLVLALRKHELFCTWGGCPSVAMGGYLQGGGEGNAARLVGYGVDNVVGVRLFDAVGNDVYASSTENTDLFWALRGGGSPGGNFGIVVEYHVQLHDAPASMLNYEVSLSRSFAADGNSDSSLQDLATFAQTIVDTAAHYPDEMSVSIDWSKSQQGNQTNDVVTVVTVAMTGWYLGDSATGISLLSPIANSFSDTHTMFQTNASIYNVSLAGFGELAAPRVYSMSKQRYVEVMPSFEFCMLQVQGLLKAPSWHSTIDLYMLGGYASTIAPDATPYVHRSALYNYYQTAVFDNLSEQEASIEWLDSFFAAALPYLGTQSYQNWPDPTREDWGPAYYGENLSRLQQLKLEWDPDCYFNFPQNLCSNTTMTAKV